MTDEGKDKIENVVIVGGGPAGLAAALYNARANLNPLVFAGSPPGGQLMLTSDVENYPGFEAILGPDLITKYREHVKKFGTRILDQNIIKVDFSSSPFTLFTSDKSYTARAVIIATGAKALWLGLDNEQRLRGRGVSACATCDAFFFKEKIVAVVGGGDTAMEEALTLTKFATKVYVIHRRSEFRASKIMQDRVIAHPKIEILWNTQIVDVLGQDKVEGIKLKKAGVGGREASTPTPTPHATSLVTPTDTSLQVDGLFLAIGHKPDTDAFKGQIALDEKGYIITTERLAYELFKNLNYQLPITNQIPNPKSQKIENWKLKIGNYRSSTSIEGVFAAGDNVDYVYRQAGTAVGMGIAAALEAERWLETSESS